MLSVRVIVLIVVRSIIGIIIIVTTVLTVCIVIRKIFCEAVLALLIEVCRLIIIVAALIIVACLILIGTILNYVHSSRFIKGFLVFCYVFFA